MYDNPNSHHQQHAGMDYYYLQYDNDTHHQQHAGTDGSLDSIALVPTGLAMAFADFPPAKRAKRTERTERQALHQDPGTRSPGQGAHQNWLVDESTNQHRLSPPIQNQPTGHRISLNRYVSVSSYLGTGQNFEWELPELDVSENDDQDGYWYMDEREEMVFIPRCWGVGLM
jgi:hypothetical protein